MAALEAAHAALDALAELDASGRPKGWAPITDASPRELRRALALQAELEGRLAGLRLHTVAAAESADAPAAVAATDVASFAAASGRNRSRSWGAAWLARLLDEKYSHVRTALAQGRIGEEHAAIIVRAAEAAPEFVDAKDLARCEEQMVDKAERMAPQRLRRAVRRLLEPLSARAADVHEGELLAAQERRAEAETWLTIGDNGDGTVSGRFTISEFHGHLLRHYLDRLAAPRRRTRHADGSPTRDVGAPEDPTQGRLNYSERLGRAFIELLEHLPSEGLGRSGLELVVHVPEEVLREGVGAATLETGAQVSWEAARKLACEAKLLPAVLKTDSQVLDLGRGTRLFTHAQSVALSARHSECAAEGCDRPFSWCELHHKIPWSRGGLTDLANAAPLCGHHHRRIHDSMYEHEWLPDGAVRIWHRWPSRRKDPRGSTPPPGQRSSSAACAVDASGVGAYSAPREIIRPTVAGSSEQTTTGALGPPVGRLGTGYPGATAVEERTTAWASPEAAAGSRGPRRRRAPLRRRGAPTVSPRGRILR